MAGLPRLARSSRPTPGRFAVRLEFPLENEYATDHPFLGIGRRGLPFDFGDASGAVNCLSSLRGVTTQRLSRSALRASVLALLSHHMDEFEELD